MFSSALLFFISASHPLVTTSLLGDAVGSRQLENKIRNQRFERIDIWRIENPEVASSAGSANGSATLLPPALSNAVASSFAHRYQVLTQSPFVLAW
jgi:hypothetical protein